MALLEIHQAAQQNIRDKYCKHIHLYVSDFPSSSNCSNEKRQIKQKDAVCVFTKCQCLTFEITLWRKQCETVINFKNITTDKMAVQWPFVLYYGC